jgi:RNA-binding protein
MKLSENQRRYLRGLGHALKPVVMVGGNGLSESVLSEIGRSIEHHELIKVRLGGGDREEREAMVATILERTGAELVQRIGHVALLFLRNSEAPRVELPRS